MFVLLRSRLFRLFLSSFYSMHHSTETIFLFVGLHSPIDVWLLFFKIDDFMNMYVYIYIGIHVRRRFTLLHDFNMEK